MSHTLTIDQGNTRTKVTVFDNDGNVVRRDLYFSFDIETLIDNFGEYDIKGIIYSSVARMDARLVETIRRSFPSLLAVLTHNTDTGVKVLYDTPQTLGSDRVAAAAGAIALFPGKPMLVVDAGTAITIDIVDSDGQFRGGNISAGVLLRTTALHKATATLPEVMPEGDTPLFGHDTETALRSGAVMGAVWEIQGAFEAARHEYQCAGIVLTGGDAELLAPHLQAIYSNSTVSVETDLVAIGLNSMLHKIQNSKQ